MLAVVGLILDREMSVQHLWCHLSTASCTRIDVLYNSAQVLGYLAPAPLVVGVVGLIRRAWAAWRSGHRWRPLAGLASVVLLLAGVWVTPGLWDTYSAELDARAQRRGQVALAELTLPAELSRQPYEDCVPSPDLICATSSLPPDEVEPLLRALLNGKPDAAICRLLPKPLLDEPCPVEASVGGHPARAWASHHLLVVRNGRPPAGATPVRPGHTRLFTLGSEVRIALTPRL